MITIIISYGMHVFHKFWLTFSKVYRKLIQIIIIIIMALGIRLNIWRREKTSKMCNTFFLSFACRYTIDTETPFQFSLPPKALHMVSSTSCLSFFSTTFYFLPKWSILFRNLYQNVGLFVVASWVNWISLFAVVEARKNYSLSLIFSENMFEICSTMLGKGIIRLCCFLGLRK